MSDPKTNKLKARLPRGLADRGAAEIAATRRMLETIRQVFERYGFEPVETPQIEYTDALGKFLPDQDRPNEGVFSFQDDDEQWLSLRYDLTAPLARYVAENFQHLTLPYRTYRSGWVFRNEKPGPGRFRQFMQFDADTVGSASMAADAEVCMMAADTMEELGIPRGSYLVKVNNRKLLDGAMEAIGLDGEANAATRLVVLRAMDKYDRLGFEGVRALLGRERRDQSGDVTRGAGLDRDQANQILRLLHILHRPPNVAFRTSDLPDWERLDSLYYQADFGSGRELIAINNFRTIDFMRGDFKNDTFQRGLDELQEIAEITHHSRYGTRRILIDPSVVRGLEYYTGPVYEVELTFPIQGDDGKPVRFGSVGGGGRYDGLVSRFRGQPVPATGFSIGVSRLQTALLMIGKLDARAPSGPVVVTVFGGPLAHYQRLVAILRSAGIRAELYLGNPKHPLRQQIKYADKRGSPCVVIQGIDEINHPSGRPHVQIKDLILGARIGDVFKDRDEYRQRQADAETQFAVPEDLIVDGVREVLARHNVVWD